MAAEPESGFTNSILVCVDCQEEFVFTASAQKYFAERGFLDPPKRCKACYTEFKNGVGGESAASAPVNGHEGGEGGPSMPPTGLGEGTRPRLRGQA